MTNHVEGTRTFRKVKEEGGRFSKRDIGESRYEADKWFGIREDEGVSIVRASSPKRGKKKGIVTVRRLVRARKH